MVLRIASDELDDNILLDTDILYLLGEALLKMRQLNAAQRRPLEVVYHAIVLMMDSASRHTESAS
jgi:hypothetical protein